MSLDLAKINVGDIVRVTQTLRTVFVDRGVAVFEDAQGAAALGLTVERGANIGSLRLEMVKKVKPAKPKIGDILTGAELADRQWVRGSMISCRPDNPSHSLVLHGDGMWHGVAEGLAEAGPWAFDDLASDADFTVLYLP